MVVDQGYKGNPVYIRYLKGTDWFSRKTVSPQAKRFAKYLRDDMRVLEIGCGSGIDANYFRACGYNVITCDVKPPISDDLGFCENLPYLDDSFDAIFCRGVLHLTEYYTALTEILRVIKQGGVCFLSYPQDIEVGEEYYQLIPIALVRQCYGQIIYEKTKLHHHGDHTHHFEEYLGYIG